MNDQRLPSERDRFRGGSGLAGWATVQRLLDVFAQAGAPILQRYELSDDELVILICLAQAGGALSVGELEGATLLEPGYLRRVVEKLEERGAVTRLRQQKDRRKVFVRMGEAGEQLVDRIAPHMLELMSEVMKPTGRDGTEFLRAKLRKVLSSPTGQLAKISANTRYGTASNAATPPDFTWETRLRSSQRPLTWGLAGWLRRFQFSKRVDRAWGTKSCRLGLTTPQLRVLASLADATGGVAEDAIGYSTGLHEENVASVLCELEKASIIKRTGEQRRSSERLVELTAQGEQKVLQSVIAANSFADELWQVLSDDEVDRVLSLFLEICCSRRPKP